VSSAASAAIGHRQQDRHFHQHLKERTMKTIQLLKTAGSIAVVAFALNATGQHIDDGAITTKVKADLLAAKNVKSTHIHVKTRKGVVWLTGSVPSAEDKTAAEDVVQNVKGVESVKNHLKIATE
jgi:hyperosmotically inducible periplasmic protein